MLFGKSQPLEFLALHEDVIHGPAPAFQNKHRFHYQHRFMLGQCKSLPGVCYDLRRGHADDLRESGCDLGKILYMGQWSGPAFLKYVNITELEASTVLSAHVDESSSEEEDCD